MASPIPGSHRSPALICPRATPLRRPSLLRTYPLVAGHTRPAFTTVDVSGPQPIASVPQQATGTSEVSMSRTTTLIPVAVLLAVLPSCSSADPQGDAPATLADAATSAARSPTTGAPSDQADPDDGQDASEAGPTIRASGRPAAGRPPVGRPAVAPPAGGSTGGRAAPPAGADTGNAAPPAGSGSGAAPPASSCAASAAPPAGSAAGSVAPGGSGKQQRTSGRPPAPRGRRRTVRGPQFPRSGRRRPAGRGHHRPHGIELPLLEFKAAQLAECGEYPNCVDVRSTRRAPGPRAAPGSARMRRLQHPRWASSSRIHREQPSRTGRDPGVGRPVAGGGWPTPVQRPGTVEA